MDCLAKARNGEFSGLTLLYTIVRFPLDSPVPFIMISGTASICVKILPKFIGYPVGIVVFATGFFLNLITTLDKIKGVPLKQREATLPSIAAFTIHKKNVNTIPRL